MYNKQIWNEICACMLLKNKLIKDENKTGPSPLFFRKVKEVNNSSSLFLLFIEYTTLRELNRTREGKVNERPGAYAKSQVHRSLSFFRLVIDDIGLLLFLELLYIVNNQWLCLRTGNCSRALLTV